MTDEEGAAHAKLLAEYRALEEEYAGQDEIPDKVDTRLGVLEAEMAKDRDPAVDLRRGGDRAGSGVRHARPLWRAGSLSRLMCGPRMSLLTEADGPG